jgi:hypothetical protein
MPITAPATAKGDWLSARQVAALYRISPRRVGEVARLVRTYRAPLPRARTRFWGPDVLRLVERSTSPPTEAHL